VGDGETRCGRIDTAHVFIDELGLGSCGFDSGWVGNEAGHGASPRIRENATGGKKLRG
jgi:hypothetical protein